MPTPAVIFPPIMVALQLIISILAFFYLIPILLLRRFHHINNVFTANVCIAVISCNMFWLLRLIIRMYLSNTGKDLLPDLIVNYFAMMWNIQVPLSCLEVAVHRLCSIVYQTNGFFKTKIWAMICIGCQWIIGILSPVPLLFLPKKVYVISIWPGIYTLLTVVVIPSLICFVINLMIFKYVRPPLNRVEPLAAIADHNHHSQLTRRDLYLLRHLIVMLSIFVAGWTPVYLSRFFLPNSNNSITFWSFNLLATSCLLFNILDLFWYNRALRRNLLRKFCPCSSK